MHLDVWRDLALETNGQASRLESVAGGGVELLAAPVGTLMSSEPEGFGVSGRVFSA
jgi:hypothetical protein